MKRPPFDRCLTAVLVVVSTAALIAACSSGTKPGWMRPLVEISFTPGALAATPAMLLGQLWYDNVSPNISPPPGHRRDHGRRRERGGDPDRNLVLYGEG